jgi:hypothetical protein
MGSILSKSYLFKSIQLWYPLKCAVYEWPVQSLPLRIVVCEVFFPSILVCRYVLRRSFGRGSYGEVWLAFHWNCNQGNITSEMGKDDNNRNGSSSNPECQDGPSNYTMYILKRIMVIHLSEARLFLMVLVLRISLGVIVHCVFSESSINLFFYINVINMQ